MFMGTYNIQVLRGLLSNRSLLSCQSDGTTELAALDDDSGRQKWNVDMIDTGVFTFKVSGGTNPEKEYLRWSSEPPSLGVYDDNFAAWMLQTVSVTPEIPAYYSIRPFQRPFTRVLACRKNGEGLHVAETDVGNGRARWQLQGPAIDPNFITTLSS